VNRAWARFSMNSLRGGCDTAGQHIPSKNTRAGEGAIRFLAHLFSRHECIWPGG
jgi:hypothetical protein